MAESRRFPFEKAAKLESEERRARHPPGPLVELVAGLHPGRVVEIGVGTGYFALPIAARLTEATVVGLDVEPRMIELVGARAAELGLGSRFRTVVAAIDDGRPVPLEDGSADLGLLVNLYHELDDREAALAEVRRLLRPGGRLVVCDWDPAGSDEHGPPVDHRVAPGTTESDLRAAGFPDVTRHEVYVDLYVLVAVRR